MAAQLNDTVGIYPQQYEEKKMEERIQAILKERFGRDLDNCTKSEIFEADGYHQTGDGRSQKKHRK